MSKMKINTYVYDNMTNWQKGLIGQIAQLEAQLKEAKVALDSVTEVLELMDVDVDESAQAQEECSEAEGCSVPSASSEPTPAEASV